MSYDIGNRAGLADALTMQESPSQTGSSGLLPGVAGDQCYSGEPEKTTKVEVLYFSGCPNHPVAVDRVRLILQQENVTAEMIEIEVRDAATADAMKFLEARRGRKPIHQVARFFIISPT